jgi:hypothetical protein
VDRVDELGGVRSDGEESLDGELLEHSVALGEAAAHEVDHLVRELERRRLEFDTLYSRKSWQGENDQRWACDDIGREKRTPGPMSNKNPKSEVKGRGGRSGLGSILQSFVDRKKRLTDMNDMALPVDHDISVVSILDLEDVASDRVGGHALDEVHPRPLERNRVDRTVLVDEEAEEVVDLRSAHLVSGGRVGDDVDDSALSKEKDVGQRRRERFSFRREI